MSKKYNTSPRQPKWTEDANIKCNRGDQYLGHSKLMFKEQTAFSTNTPLLLGSFTCEKIAIGDKFSVSDLKGVWPVEVKIMEATKSSGANSIMVMNMRATLDSKNNTVVSLPKPILIRPKLFYFIPRN